VTNFRGRQDTRSSPLRHRSGPLTLHFLAFLCEESRRVTNVTNVTNFSLLLRFEAVEGVDAAVVLAWERLPEREASGAQCWGEAL
jgi:hypothetical protein